MLVIQLPGIARADEVTDWNLIMVEALRVGQISPVVGSRHAAIVQSAVYDAVNGIERRFDPIHVAPNAPRGASVRAAAVQAAYATLVQLLPSQQAVFSAKREASLAAIASAKAVENSQSIARGIEWGQEVAEAILLWRSTDGFLPNPPPYFGGNAIGQWRSTPPAFASFAAYQLGFVTPWVIPSPLQFPVPGPPALTSARYTQDFNEVKAIGSLNSQVRTADQTVAANFWGSTGPNYFWGAVAIRLGEAQNTTLSENSRLLAQMSLAIADSAIAVWRYKRQYDFWRPITAIEFAEMDGNPFTSTEPNWTPLLANPAYPDYPSGHNGASAAALTVLSNFFGENTTFFVDSNNPLQAGVTRMFSSFNAAKQEIVDTRVHTGIHFRFADEDARDLGTRIANYVIANAFQPLHGEKKGQLR
jgi:membrane-associated phospholipid phosphatase